MPILKPKTLADFSPFIVSAVRPGNGTRPTIAMVGTLVLFLLLLVPSLLFAQGISQLSGTVVDTSGAVIAGATVQVRSANGTVQITTRSDTNGSFIISGLSAGNYRLVVSNPGFETKESPSRQGPLRHRPRCASLWL